MLSAGWGKECEFGEIFMKRVYSSLALILLAAASMVAAEAPVVRMPAVAGTFYPSDSAELAAMVTGQLAAAPEAVIEGEVVAIVVPHAGLVYSGGIAAHAYKVLEGRSIETVVLCGPSHRYGFHGASVYGPGVVWQTPLGTVACNDSCANRLVESSEWLKVTPEAHLKEHSLEVQLPYIQSVLPEAEIVPVTMGYPDAHTIEAVEEALAAMAREPGVVMVASSDWQHYRSAGEGYPMDSLGIACLLNFDAERLHKHIERGEVEACGGAAVVAVMRAAKKSGADGVKILKYGDSGDMTGDKSSVVGYVAAVMYRSERKESSVDGGSARLVTSMETYELTEEERQKLLAIARQSITTYLADGTLPVFEVTGKLAEPGAAFVTLEKHEQLRGCIGHVEAVEPLFRTVAICAIQAAVADPRFQPVTAGEVSGLEIEISVLTPLQVVTNFEEIEVGRDGLVVTMGPNRGLLLPQVATEWGWDREEFLRQTCRKAGLPGEAYKLPEAKVERFQALVFGE